tara:strand:+ start:614 stop:2551 length:1938 start_codon:yes stop_codon:yes gene_type:complete
MAIKFVNNVDFGFYNTEGFALENSSSAPVTTVEGSMYYDTDDNKPYYRNDSEWVDLAGVTTFSNVNGTFISCTTVNTNASGDVTVGTIDLSASGTPGSTTYLTGDNSWSVPIGLYLNWKIRADSGSPNPDTVLTGQTVDIAGGTAIGTALVTSGGNTYTVTVNNEGVTDVVAGTNITVSGTTGSVTINSTDQYVGTVTSITTGAGLTGGTITTSGTILVDYLSTDNIILAAADGTSATLSSSDKILVSTGDAKYTNLSQIKTLFAPVTAVTGTAPVVSSGGLTPAISVTTAAVTNGSVNLSTGDQIYDFVTGQGYEDGTVTSVTVTGGSGLTGSGTVTTTGTITLNVDYAGTDNYILVPASATAASGDSIAFSDVDDSNTVKESTLANIPMVALTAVKTYIDNAVANVGTFQGGYNATTNTPDLDVSPSSDIQNGWFWAVTTAGTFFSEAVQIGDLIFANQDNPGATFGNWTVVQSGSDVATAGATDGATTKGVAGFDSATFTATANGWIEMKEATASAVGVGYVTAGTGIDVSVSGGEFTVSQESGSGRSKKVVLNSSGDGVAVATAGDVRTWTLTVDNAAIFGSGALGANIMAECYKVSNGTTAYPEVVRDTSNTNELEFNFDMPVLPSDGDYVVLLHNVAGI